MNSNSPEYVRAKNRTSRAANPALSPSMVAHGLAWRPLTPALPYSMTSSARAQHRRHVETERLGSLDLDHQFVLRASWVLCCCGISLVSAQGGA
jgi:hypothetical protein